MSNLVKRTLTGILFLVVLIGGMMWHILSFGLLFFSVSVLTTTEFCQIMNKREGVQVNTLMTSLASAFLFLGFFVYSLNLSSGIIFMPYLLILIYLLVAELYRKQTDPIRNWACTMFSQLYIALPFALLNMLGSTTAITGMSSRFWLFPLAMFIFLWSSDTGAYCVGSLLHNVFPAKLFPRISPNKSWVGSIGGGVLAIGMAVLVWWLTRPDMEALLAGKDTLSLPVFSLLTLPKWIGLALVVTVFGTWGDLVESLIKRTLGIKDSGNILPGHGGMLDRFDSALLAIPASTIYIYSVMM